MNFNTFGIDIEIQTDILLVTEISIYILLPNMDTTHKFYYLPSAAEGHDQEIIKGLPYIRESVCHVFT